MAEHQSTRCQRCAGQGYLHVSEPECNGGVLSHECDRCGGTGVTRHVPASITVACCMSGTRETMQVAAIGQFGVSFRYGDDASVIARGDDLRRMRAILDRQIANWEASNA